MKTADLIKSRYFLETIHIPLWLIKDICWLMDFKTAGVIMAIPTILVALLVAWISRKEKDHFLPNLSIALWILANANWMIAEFYSLPYKAYSIYPFTLGVLVFVIFLFIKLIDYRKLR